MNFDFSGRKILIAGGTGFIGRRATKFLAECGARVYVISRNAHESKQNIQYICADLNDRKQLDNAVDDAFDACVYMAAYIPEAGQKKETYLDAQRSTLEPLVNFCDRVAPHIKRFVYISSIDVLGKYEKPYYDETAEPNVATPYGLAKYCGEFYVRNYCEQYGVNWICLRFSQVYGAREPIVRIIPIMKNALISGTPFSIFTDGKEKRRFLYVNDAVQAISCALQSDRTGIYNIAGKDVCTIEELSHTIEKVYGKKLALKILNKVQGSDNVPSIEKALNELRYLPQYSLADGLKCMKEEEDENIS